MVRKVVSTVIKRPFLFWCQKVLPLVYDESLSYYEVLCKVVDYINKLIEQDKVFATDIDSMRAEVATLKQVVDNWNSNAEKFFNEWMDAHLAVMIMPEITDSGYFAINIPKMWDRVKFETTGLDVVLALQPEYGHLVLSY